MQKQKAGYKDMFGRNKALTRQVFEDQFRQQRMKVTSWGTDKAGNAVADYTMPKHAAADMEQFGNKVKMAKVKMDNLSRSMINWGKNTQWAGRQLTVGFSVPFAIFAAATGKMAYDADVQLTRIAKVYDTKIGASAGDRTTELANLRAKSWNLAAYAAKNYGASMKDTLGIEADLAAAGLKGNELISSTKETMRIATLGELDYNQAVTMSIALQNAFHLSGKKLTDTFNFMNAAENSTSLSIKDIADATPRAAAALASLGVSAKEMVFLLASMKESGVQAMQGANAIKSATARIINPVPKAIKYYEQFGISLENISKKSGGNLVQFLKLLGEAQTTIVGKTEKETKRLKAKGVADTFGTYQFSRLTAALTNIADAYAGVHNQAYKVKQLMGDDSKEKTATIAAQEMYTKMNSASGQFQKSLKSVQVTLAKIGQDFLPWATSIVKGMGKVFKFFNAMPNWSKNALLVAAGIVAMTGPLIMLIGLTANLGGSAMRGFGTLFKFLTRGKFEMDMFTRSQRAAALMAEQVEKANLSQAESLRILRQEIQLTAAAQGYAVGVAEAGMAGHLGGTGTVMTPLSSHTLEERVSKLPPNIIHTVDKNGNSRFYKRESNYKRYTGKRSWDNLPKNVSIIEDKNGVKTAVYDRKMTRIATPKGIANYQKTQALIKKNMDGTVEAVDEASQKAAGASEKVRKNWTGAKAASGLMAAGMISSLIPGAQKYANIIMSAGMGFMAVGMVKGGIQSSMQALAARKASKAAALAEVTAAKASGTAAAATAAGVSSIGTKAKSILPMLKRVTLTGFGPWGLALGAAATAFVLIYKHMHQAQKRQQALVQDTKGWSQILGVAVQSWNNMKIPSLAGSGFGSDIINNAETLKKNKTMSGVIDAYTKARDSIEQTSIAQREWTILLTKSGLTTKQATAQMQAFFFATGDDAWTAADKVKDLGKTMGKTANEFKNRNSIGLLNKSLLADIDKAGSIEMPDKAKALVGSLGQALSDAPNALQRMGVFKNFKDQMDSHWTRTLAEMAPLQSKLLKSYGVKTGQDLANLMAQQSKITAGTATKEENARWDAMLSKHGAADNYQFNDIISATLLKEGKFADIEKEIVRAFADKYNLGKDINTMLELQNALQNKGYVSTLDQAKAEYRRLLLLKSVKGPSLGFNSGYTGFMDIIGKKSSEITAKQRLDALNTVRVNILGLKRTTHLQDMFTDGATAGTRAWARTHKEVDKTGSAIAHITAAEKSKIGTMMDKVAGRQTAALEKRQSAESAALDAQVEAHNKALDARQTAVDAHYDNMAKRMQKYYDHRVEMVNKTIKAEEDADKRRQKIFDAEMLRLQRLAEAQNTKIDFNVAVNTGNLDEAAKIMNNATATTGKNAMDDEATRATARSEAIQARLQKKIDRLEKSRDRRAESIDKAKANADKAIAIEKDKYAKYAEMQKKSLEARQEAEKKALLKKQAADKKAMIVAVNLLKKGTFDNKAELTSRLRTMGLKYADFANTVKGLGLNMANYIKSEMVKKANQAARDIGGAPFKKSGQTAAMKFIAGMAANVHMTPGEFLRWAKTGAAKGAAAGADAGQHTGGEIGKTKFGTGGQRRGMTGAQKSQEMLINAQKGEYMINKKAVGRYGVDLMNSINDGKFGTGGAGNFNMLRQFGPLAYKTLNKGSKEGWSTKVDQIKAALKRIATKKKADEAKSGGAGPGGGPIVAGSGGRHRPVSSRFGLTQGVHDQSTGFPAVDFGVPVGTPVYAANNGRISKSYDIRGYEPRAPGGGGGYRSYGRVMEINHGKYSTLYAHLSKRLGKVGQAVKGGATIGKSGNTGNSTGPHLHFGARGISPTAFLREGGELKWDNTMVQGHKGESMLTKPLTQKFKDGIQNSGGDGGYSISQLTIDMRGATVNSTVDFQKGVEDALHNMEGRIGRKRVVR